MVEVLRSIIISLLWPLSFSSKYFALKLKIFLSAVNKDGYVLFSSVENQLNVSSL